MTKQSQKRNPLLIPMIVETVILITVIIVFTAILRNQSAMQESTPELPVASQEENVTVAETENTASNQSEIFELPQDTLAKDIVIETDYADLYVPGIWEDSIKTIAEKSEFSETIKFIGTVGDKEQELFNISFGGDDGIPIGIYTDADGYSMDVTVKYIDFEPDNSWSEKEIDTICAMQETINHIFEQLGNDERFQAI